MKQEDQQWCRRRLFVILVISRDHRHRQQLSGSVIILSAGVGVFGVVASLMLPFSGGGGRVGERSWELTLPERLKGPAGEETPFFRKGLSGKLMKIFCEGFPKQTRNAGLRVNKSRDG